MLRTNKGLSLTGVLITIGIIIILSGIILIAVNPAQKYAKNNDLERKSEINSILSAVYQYKDSKIARGELPECIVNSVLTAIPECNSPLNNISDFDGAVELGKGINSFDCSRTLVPYYIEEIPVDPTPTYTADNTGYWICQDNSDIISRIYILATGVEDSYEDGGCTSPTNSLNAVMCVSG
ncbi:hypothetical protein JW758_01840 [Candidatus Peregrinibacteria bacterium]|nr:hypothetical protein [Candidatus Peregrinibacteria bacterium]